MTDWQPGISLDSLRQRGRVLAELRSFFQRRDVLEVDVPVLATTSVTDRNIDSISASFSGSPLLNSSSLDDPLLADSSVSGYLQTSPEYFMKRLLAAGSGDIFCLGKAFRNGEVGRRHNPEFTMLEWYRCGWHEHQLMDELAELIGTLLPNCEIHKLSYADLFLQHLEIDPHQAALSQLQKLAVEAASDAWSNESRANCLDLLFSVVIEPQLSGGLVLVFDYPACQAALATCYSDAQGREVSRRFEAFLNRVELANGYFELTDGQEQARRFAEDQQARKAAGKPDVEVDQHLLAALESGLPVCSGVALGVDRLLMQIESASSIDQVMPFSWDRC
jgi:elongation factor P--(R)-beta-lysine ligase